MANPFRTKDIARAFWDLDISDTEPSSTKGKKSRPAPLGLQGHFAGPETNKPRQDLTFLALPSEIRIRIYDLLLISRFNREQNPSWAVGKTCQKQIDLHMVQAPQYRTMEPAILQTCKQIYNEAIPILYSQNIFNISTPEQMFRFMTQIGSINVKFIKSLDIWVPWSAELFPWLALLAILSEKATGLKYITLGWGADCEFPWQFRRGAKERGLGDNLHFVRALAGIHGLEVLTIKGFYAKHWPAYLRKKVSGQVRAECGHYLEMGADDDSETENWVRDLNEKNLHSFAEYQKGTEDLIPWSV